MRGLCLCKIVRLYGQLHSRIVWSSRPAPCAKQLQKLQKYNPTTQSPTTPPLPPLCRHVLQRTTWTGHRRRRRPAQRLVYSCTVGRSIVRSAVLRLAGEREEGPHKKGYLVPAVGYCVAAGRPADQLTAAGHSSWSGDLVQLYSRRKLAGIQRSLTNRRISRNC
jgi:hypothetical protein